MNTFQTLMANLVKISLRENFLSIQLNNVHVFISDIKRKRRTRHVQNIRLLRNKDASWDGFPVILNLEK